MQVKIKTVYKEFEIEVSGDCVSSADRAKVVREIFFTIDNINERTIGGQVQTIAPLDEEDYTLVTPNQKTYLKKLGYPEEKIEAIKSKDEASAIITKLQQKKDK